MGVSYAFLSSAQSNCAHLKGAGPPLFVDYLDYLLGKYCYGLLGSDGRGGVVSGPSWQLVLSYEHQMRVHAMEKCRKGCTFKEALEACMRDPLIKERHFTTPMAQEAMQGMRRERLPSSGHQDPPQRLSKRARKAVQGQPQRQQQPSEGKGTGKNKGKGKGKDNDKNGCARSTPDGRPVCYRFNEASGCKLQNCRFAHLCGRCFASDHSIMNCPQRK